MDLSQYFTSADLAGIAPEIILTVTALFVLTLEMAKLSRPGIMLLVAAIGIVLSGGALAQAGNEERILFGGMLRLNSFTTFLDFLYLAVGLVTLILSQG